MHIHCEISCYTVLPTRWSAFKNGCVVWMVKPSVVWFVEFALNEYVLLCMHSLMSTSSSKNTINYL